MTETLILLIESDEEDRHASRAQLESLGYLVMAANGADKAFALLETLRPHAIVMGLRPTDPDDLETVRRLQAEPGTRGLPLLVLEGEALPSSTPTPLPQGCAARLPRTAEGEELRRQLHTLIRGTAGLS